MQILFYFLYKFGTFFEDTDASATKYNLFRSAEAANNRPEKKSFYANIILLSLQNWYIFQ